MATLKMPSLSSSPSSRVAIYVWTVGYGIVTWLHRVRRSASYPGDIVQTESARVARMASGGQHGLAQSVFQVGGNAGSSLGPLLAAFIVLSVT